MPPFSNFLERFDAAANLFFCKYNEQEAGKYSLKLCEEHGLAWKDDSPNNHPAKNPCKCITASDAPSVVGLVAVDTMQQHIGEATRNCSKFKDVQLGYTLPKEAVMSNEEVTDVSVLKKDVPLGRHGTSFLLSIHGHFISPNFYRKIICHIQEDLTFCKSPTSNRMLRVSSEVPNSIIFLFCLMELFMRTTLEIFLMEFKLMLKMS